MRPHDSRPAPQGRSKRLTRVLGTGLCLAFVLLTTTGCNTEELPRIAFPEPATEEAPRILLLWQGSWLAAIVTGAFVWALIIWACIFHRKKKHNDEIPIQTRYNVPIEALYTIVPFIMVVVLFYFTARDEDILLDNDRPEDLTVNVVGRQWAWTFNYLKGDLVGPEGAYDAGTPKDRSQLWLPVNKLVRFELTSPDVIHGFWINEFLMKMDVMPGLRNAFELTPNKIGDFNGKCAELCGVDHSRMLFDIKVVSEADYRDHLNDLRARGQGGNLPSGVEDTAADRDRAYNIPIQDRPKSAGGSAEEPEHGAETSEHGSETSEHGAETSEHGAETETHGMADRP